MIKTSFNERKWTDLISDPKSYEDFGETGPRALEGELKALTPKIEPNKHGTKYTVF